MCCMDVGFSRSTQIVFYRLVLTCLNIEELRAAYIEKGTTFETQGEVANMYIPLLPQNPNFFMSYDAEII